MVVTIILLTLAGLAKAVMDTSSEGTIKWKPEGYWWRLVSWGNKWKNGDKSQGEAFPGSSTIFVAFTDGWHLSQFVFLNSLIIGTVLTCQHMNVWFALIVASAVPRLSFEITYRKLKG